VLTLSKPQLASLVNGLEVAPSPRFAVDGDILVEVSRQLGHENHKDGDKMIVRLSDWFVVLWNNEYQLVF